MLKRRLLAVFMVVTFTIFALAGEIHFLNVFQRNFGALVSSSLSSLATNANTTTPLIISDFTVAYAHDQSPNNNIDATTVHQMMPSHNTTTTTTTSRVASNIAFDKSSSAANTANISQLDDNINNSASIHPIDATLAVGLSGEFGNHLHKLARAYGIAQMARDEFNISMHLLLQQQLNRRRNRDGSPRIIDKAISTQQHLQRCFGFLKSYDFGLGNQLLEERSSEIRNYFEQPADITMEGDDLDDIRSNLDKLMKHARTLSTSTSSVRNTNNTTRNELHALPRLLVETKSLRESFLVDRYYDMIRQTFLFNDTECCHEIADSDESVFHYRGFAKEMPRAHRKKGYQELSPYRIAHQLFGRLQPGDKIAIVGRFVDEEAKMFQTEDNSTNATSTTHQIVRALQSRGLQVRVVTGGDAMQDFCFLKSAQKELVGMIKSTYVKWAFLLGQANMTRFYVVDSPLMRKAHGNNLTQLSYQWTHPALKSRYKFELYPSEEE
jgi:hypothetical protein